jgi:hypothetical protein
MTETVILDEADIDRMHGELDRLYIEQDAIEARIVDINRALVASGEARLREADGAP